MRIVILDASQRSALAATRSLGSAGHRVVTADESAETLAGASRYSSHELVYPSPYTASLEFMRWAESTFADRAYDAALPMTEVTTDLLVRHREKWPDLRLPFAPIETIDALSDKVNLFRQAQRLGVGVPHSVVIDEPSDIARAIDEIGFPAILKPRRSRIWLGTRFLPTAVRRANDRAELDALLETEPFRSFPFLYQEVVGGHGEGVFALYDKGQPVCFFAHKRIREKPPDGGVSVLCESASPNERLLEHSKRLLDDVHWHGVAMVEYKVSDDDAIYLMEVNARFWGSLQLAIDAGVDFPRLLVDGISGAVSDGGLAYRRGRRLRWFLGDVDRLYIICKNLRRYGLPRLIGETFKFLIPRPLSTRHEVWRWNDPRPALRELRYYVRDLAR